MKTLWQYYSQAILKGFYVRGQGFSGASENNPPVGVRTWKSLRLKIESWMKTMLFDNTMFKFTDIIVEDEQEEGCIWLVLQPHP